MEEREEQSKEERERMEERNDRRVDRVVVFNNISRAMQRSLSVALASLAKYRYNLLLQVILVYGKVTLSVNTK